jgi:hypothetical protein
MSGIVAAAQSSGCCCRPVEGCTCSDPNRPGAVADRQITAIAVSGEITYDHAVRRNGSSVLGCNCECFALEASLLGSGAIRYGYQSQGSIVDPDFIEPDDPCQGCTNGACGGCNAYSISTSTSTIICPQALPGAQAWQSRSTQFGDNIVGQWSWRGRRVGYCIGFDSQNFPRVRKFCQFPPLGPLSFYPEIDLGVPVDPNGAFININTGEYIGTPYGETLGRLHAIQSAQVLTVPSSFAGGPCEYRVSIGLGFKYTWQILRDLATLGFSPDSASVGATYRKPCLAPTDTVLGTYEIEYVPEYDFRYEDPECGAMRDFEELRVDFPRFIEVT